MGIIVESYNDLFEPCLCKLKEPERLEIAALTKVFLLAGGKIQSVHESERFTIDPESVWKPPLDCTLGAKEKRKLAKEAGYSLYEGHKCTLKHTVRNVIDSSCAICSTFKTGSFHPPLKKS